MPTKKKRVGFIPREEVMKVIDTLSIVNNLSNSKIISILVEEALCVRGIFNNKTGKLNESYQDFKGNIQDLAENSSDLNANEKFTINTKLHNQEIPIKTNLGKEINREIFDLQTYKEFISFMKFKKMLDEFNN